jgi:Eco29kI restriction endonuclease
VCDKHRFDFEFDKAFTAQLIEKFEASPAHPLAEDVAPPEKGVYALYRKGKLVYAGKALDTTLKRRLAEHTKKISSRQNVSLKEMTCRFLTIDSDWFVRAGEHALIESYEPEWNASGFGSHVPGKGRPGIRKSRWDTDFPPN